MFAALSEGKEAIDYYLAWRNAVDFETISFSECELLPMVYTNLQNANFTDHLTAKIKGIARKTWLENEIYKNAVSDFLEIITKAGIDFILLNREPLTFSNDNPEGLIALRNFQILLRRPITKTILISLETCGWKPTETDGNFSFNEKVLRFQHTKYLNICLIFESGFFADDIWKSSESISFCSKILKTLNPTDFLLQVLKEEFLPYPKRKDAIWLLLIVFNLQVNRQIDWERLARKCHKLDLNFSMAEMLDEADRTFPSKSFSFVRYKFLESPPNRIERLFSAYRSLRKSYKKTGEKYSVFGFIRFLQYHWKANSVFEIPLQIGKRLFKF